MYAIKIKSERKTLKQGAKSGPKEIVFMIERNIFRTRMTFIFSRVAEIFYWLIICARVLCYFSNNIFVLWQ
jgi:hypothetical protein